jgi:hypothetical protein
MSNKHYKEYEQQRQNANQRGIPFLLTFSQWLSWWGDDLARRGSGHDKLCMMRKCDRGAYELGNIEKGYAKDNMSTMGNCLRNKHADANNDAHQTRLDMMMFVSSNDPDDFELTKAEREEMQLRYGYDVFGTSLRSCFPDGASLGGRLTYTRRPGKL